MCAPNDMRDVFGDGVYFEKNAFFGFFLCKKFPFLNWVSRMRCWAVAPKFLFSFFFRFLNDPPHTRMQMSSSVLLKPPAGTVVNFFVRRDVSYLCKDVFCVVAVWVLLGVSIVFGSFGEFLSIVSKMYTENKQLLVCLFLVIKINVEL